MRLPGWFSEYSLPLLKLRMPPQPALNVPMRDTYNIDKINEQMSNFRVSYCQSSLNVYLN